MTVITYRQEAQLSQRDRAMLRVIEYFAKSLKVIGNSMHSVDRLRTWRSIITTALSRFIFDILVENRDFFTPHVFESVRGLRLNIQ